MNPRSPRPVGAFGVLAVLAGLVLLTTACSASPSSNGSPPAAGPGGLSSTLLADELALARCMRAHGVPDYPDPNSTGALPPSTNKQKLVSNPHFLSANRACAHLIPNSVIAAQNHADERAYLRFASCMRGHGQPNFPDPIVERDGTPIFNLPPAMVTADAPQVRTAALRCQSLLHLAQLPRYES